MVISFARRIHQFLLLCFIVLAAAPHAQAALIPDKVLWAWQRAEDLSTIDTKKFAVAYMACHVLLKGEATLVSWRQQSLKVPEQAVLIPVVRIDCDNRNKAKLNEKQLETVLQVLKRAAAGKRTAELQIDFDAREDERDFYRKLLVETKKSLAPDLPLSITALASWCLFDNWIKDLPVDEMVPMMFSLGRDREKILKYFSEERDFLESGCCKSLGVSLEDAEINRIMIPLAKRRKIPVRIFVFTRSAWTAKKLDSLRELLRNQ